VDTAQHPTAGARIITYRFTGACRREFHIRLDPQTFAVLSAPSGRPDWTALTFEQCPNCPLDPTAVSSCPVAANLVEVLDAFRETLSCEITVIEIQTPERTVVKRGGLMEGLSGLVGLYMVCSGCPILDRLRPMAFIHLPFASLEETLLRAASMYLLAQYFRSRRGLAPDWSLDGLAGIYAEVMAVNAAFHRRIVGLQVADANLNALFRLDGYAQFANRRLLRNSLGTMEEAFRVYWDGEGPRQPPDWARRSL
jgi:hypothetical protein